MNETIGKLTWMYVGLLVLLGIVGYVMTSFQSVTAMIPAFFAIVVALLFLVLKSKGNAAFWTLIILAIVGIVATAKGVPQAFSYMSGSEVARPAAVISQSVMAIVSCLFLIMLFMKKAK
ncbi:MAG: hypothetical protein DWP97_13360 [Calditrichaeota bacterium]|nr:MAG: hypothetical protein DWP97_13360 [Calditrichota bacterium]